MNFSSFFNSRERKRNLTENSENKSKSNIFSATLQTVLNFIRKEPKISLEKEFSQEVKKRREQIENVGKQDGWKRQAETYEQIKKVPKQERDELTAEFQSLKQERLENGYKPEVIQKEFIDFIRGQRYPISYLKDPLEFINTVGKFISRGNKDWEKTLRALDGYSLNFSECTWLPNPNWEIRENQELENLRNPNLVRLEGDEITYQKKKWYRLRSFYSREETEVPGRGVITFPISGTKNNSVNSNTPVSPAKSITYPKIPAFYGRTR